MKNCKHKIRAGVFLILVLTLLTAASAAAAEEGWKQDEKGWWYQNADGSYPKESWQWIDGNHDGIAECYYFDRHGYMLSDDTKGSYQVNDDGQWVKDGIVMVKIVGDTASVSDGTVAVSLLSLNREDQYRFNTFKDRATRRNGKYTAGFYLTGTNAAYPAFVQYALEKKYKRLVLTYAPAAEYSGNCSSYIQILDADSGEELANSAENLTTNSKENTLEADVSDCRIVEIRVQSTVKNHKKSPNATVLFTNAVVQ